MEDDSYKEQLSAILDTDKSSLPQNSSSVPFHFQKTTWVVIICAVFVISAVFLSFLVNQPKTNDTESPSLEKSRNYIEKNIVFFDFMYQHKILYPEYCKKNGYELKNYPHVFDKMFQKEIIENDHMFKMFSEFFPDFKKDLSDDNQKRLSNLTESEFNIIRKALIISQIKEKNPDFAAKIKWNDKYYDTYPIKLVCMYLDENAKLILETTYKKTTQIIH